MKRRFALFVSSIVLLFCSAALLSCDKEDDEDLGGSSASASVKITDVKVGNKRNGKYIYRITVKATGASAGEIKDIGVTWGKTSGATERRSGTRGEISTTRSIDLSANSTYYIKGYVTTSGGTSYTPSKRIKVPK